MDSEVDKLQFEIKGALFQLTSDQLIQICDFLAISGANRQNITGKTPNALVTLISKHIECAELRQLEDKGMSALLSLMDMIKEVQKAIKNSTPEKEDEEQEKLGRDLEQLKLIIQQKEAERQIL
ncbi:hypothetical protein GOODEAATRI_033178 [Goodea atripinnis]|uniref:Uncharacterized protein n=1 Tax=Goodea atripinnis TaxID=208336 RepID=A0ABV0P9R1_9TELE